MDKKTALIILDGWGIGTKDESDGVHLAKTPFFDHLMKNHPNDEQTYYKVRSYDNTDVLDNAKRFYYLRKTCFL